MRCRHSIMNFSTLVALCFHLVFYEGVNSSGNLLSQNENSYQKNFDNVLEKFFRDFKKVYLEDSILRHVTIVGAPSNYLEQIRPLFDSYKPYVICTNVNECDYRKKFSQGSFVVIFLEDLSEKTFRKNIEVLLHCRNCEVLFISDGIIQRGELSLIFTLAMQHNVPYSKLAHLGKDVIELYSDFVATNCSMEVRLVRVWRPGDTLDKLRTWAFRSREMNGCPVSVSSLTFSPKMIIKENENGSLTIAGGREGKLLLAIASKLNFTIDLRYPSVEDQLKYSRKVAILYDVASGISQIGIGRLRPANYLNNTIAASFPYDEECITWGVPRIMNWSNDIILVEFSREVWAFVALVFAIGCIIGYAHRSIVTMRRNEQKCQGFITIVLDVVALHLGNPVVYAYTSAGGRFMLIAYLSYAMVITTGYKTSLASILATNEGTPTIVDAQGIIDANLEVGGSFYDYNILKDQVNDSDLTSKLLERFVINNNDTESWDRLLFDYNYAFLARRSAMNWDRQRIVKSNGSVHFNVLNGCVLSYPTVMFFQSGSFLRTPVDHIIQRLGESGILRNWDYDKFDADKALKRRTAKKYFDRRAIYKFWNIFILYFICLSVSLFTFLMELLIPRVVSTKRRHPVNQVHHDL